MPDFSIWVFLYTNCTHLSCSITLNRAEILSLKINTAKFKQIKIWQPIGSNHPKVSLIIATPMYYFYVIHSFDWALNRQQTKTRIEMFFSPFNIAMFFSPRAPCKKLSKTRNQIKSYKQTDRVGVSSFYFFSKFLHVSIRLSILLKLVIGLGEPVYEAHIHTERYIHIQIISSALKLVTIVVLCVINNY